MKDLKISEFLDILRVTGKVDNATIEEIRHKPFIHDKILSSEAINLVKYAMKKVSMDGSSIVQLLYALGDEGYFNYLSILKSNDYEGNFERAVTRFLGQKSIIRIYKGSDLNFGKVKVRRLGTNKICVVDKNEHIICEGSIFIMTNEALYREYNKKYMLMITKDGEVNKIKRRFIRGVNLGSYMFNTR